MWIDRIMRTEPIDKSKIVPAIEGLYKVSGLKKPRVVVVPSPVVAAYASGMAAAIWHLRKNATATDDATDAATATATYDATATATYDATDAAPYAATYAATVSWLSDLAAKFSPDNADFLLGCVRLSHRMYQGGNMWGQYDSYLTADRDVLGLTDLDCWEKYKYWEQSAIEGSWRYMHEEFCIVSDFPEHIKVDDQNRPHCESGPSHRWRDGWELYHLCGVRFDKDEWQKIVNQEFTLEDLAKEGMGADKTTVALKYLRPDRLLKHCNLS